MEMQGHAVQGHPQGCSCPGISLAWTLPPPATAGCSAKCLLPVLHAAGLFLHVNWVFLCYFSAQLKGIEQGRAVFHLPEHPWLWQSQKQTSLAVDAQAESASNPQGGGKSLSKVPPGHVSPRPCLGVTGGLLTCQASSCCERFTFCWMASSSWLLRDIMSILHLASSTSTAFFLGRQREIGACDFFFFVGKEVLNISLKRGQQFLSLASLQIISCSSPLYSIHLKSGTELETPFL